MACADSGQDAETHPGLAWPEKRFVVQDACVHDSLTGLTWSRDAAPGVFPVSWHEALDAISALNDTGYAGYSDWRLPQRRELFSLMSFDSSRPALPSGYPFDNVFQGWYWSSTTYAGTAPEGDAGHAWRVHMEGARMFYGRKTEYSLFWPVRGVSTVLPVSGQKHCYDATSRDTQRGISIPNGRFTVRNDAVHDALTGLHWARKADVCGPVLWEEALAVVRDLRKRSGVAWRLPTIRELESLVDAAHAFPALTATHPFAAVGDQYWSSTSSSFAWDWAMVLYLGKGAVGVGYKTAEPFLVWPVHD